MRFSACKALVLSIVALSVIAPGCVTRKNYEGMLEEQQTLEAALRSEIAADQVEITQLENGIRVRLSNDLLYRSGSVELSSSGRSALDKVVGQLSAMAEKNDQIDVVGHTDSVPVGERLAEFYPTNWELAAARACRVVRYLQGKGVNPVAMEAISVGPYEPVASNDTPEGRAKNRRTELLLRPH